MRATMASIYGKMDIRIREVELPPIADDEVLLKVISNGICFSTYKAVKEGTAHLRIPNNVAETPVVTGHEFAGVIEQVGEKWRHKYRPGQSCTLQAGIRYKGSEDAPGYSFPYFGGNTTYTIIPAGYLEMDCLITYDDDYYAFASMGEPVSCVLAAFHTNFHDYLEDFFVYDHLHGTLDGGQMLLMAACGPMGIAAIDYAVHGPRKPRRLVVTDINPACLARARQLISEEAAAKNGVVLTYLNPETIPDERGRLMELSEGRGFDDIIVFAVSSQLIKLGSDVLGYNGCLNFFAGPTDKQFKADINFYDIHYRRTHYIGNSGGNLDDIHEMMQLSREGKMTPEFLITHVTGLKPVPEIIMNLPNVPGGKKLVYPHVDIPLMAMEDFTKRAGENETFAKISRVLENNNMVWCKEAEQILLREKCILS